MLLSHRNYILEISLHSELSPKINTKVFELSSGSFTVLKEINYHLPKVGVYKLIDVKCVRNGTSGVNQTALLLQKEHQVKEKLYYKLYIFVINSDTSLWLPIGEVEIKSSVTNGTLICGPNALFNMKQNLFYTIGSGQVRLAQKVDSIENVDSVLACLDLFPEKFLALVQVHGTSGSEDNLMDVDSEEIFREDNSGPNAIIIESLYMNSNITVCKKNVSCLKVEKFIPNAYLPSVGKVLMQHSDNTVTSKLNETEKQEPVVFCTTINGQLLLFSDGKLEKCVKLPCKDVLDLTLVDGHHGQKLMVVINKNEKVAVVDLHSFKVVHEYEELNTAIVGDFVLRGGRQLLLTKYSEKSKDGLWAKKFLLTDYGPVHITQGIEADQLTPVADVEQMQIACKALNGRLQMAQQELEQKKRIIFMKEQIIKSSVRSLKKMTLGHDAEDSIHDGLHPILTSEENATRTEAAKLPDPSSDEEPLEARDIWWKVWESSLVIGVKVINTSECNTQNVELWLVPGEGSEKDITWRSVSANPETPPQKPHRKKQKISHKQKNFQQRQILKPGESSQVTAAMGVPVFVRDSFVILQLYLAYNTSTGSESDGRKQSFSCGELKLSALELTKEENCLNITPSMCAGLNEKEKNRMLCVMNSVQQRIELLFKCKMGTCDLHHLPRLLAGAGLIQDPMLNCLVWGRPGLLCGTRLYITEEQADCVSTQVFYRDESSLLLLIQLVYKNLPDDVIILPTDSQTKMCTLHVKDQLQDNLNQWKKMLPVTQDPI